MNALTRLLAMLAALLLLGILMAWLAGLFNTTIAPGTIAPGRFAPPLNTQHGEVVTVAAVDQPTFEYASGTVRAKNETEVSARIMATIGAIHVRAGDWVEAGAALVELDSRELGARVSQATEVISSAEARLAEAHAAYQRNERLQAANAVSKSELERALAAYRSAQAELRRARDLLAEATSARSHASIVAPITGRVVERYAEPGDTAVPGKPLLRLYNPDALRLEADIRESMAARLRVGDSLSVHIDATGDDIEAAIEEIVPSADPGSRSFVIKLHLPDGLAVYPGMFGRLALPTGSARRMLVPARAVQQLGQLSFVIVRDQQGDSRRFVQTGRENAQGLVDVLSGLDAGEQVVLPPE